MRIFTMRLLLTVLLLSASTVAASPVIVSVSPSAGSAGTRVTIEGTGFSNVCTACSSPVGGLSVLFGGARAIDVRLTGSTRIEAFAPPRFPGTVDLTVVQRDGSQPSQFTVANAFTYTESHHHGLEPVLLPIFLPPVRGAFGSEFHTTARVRARYESIELFGVDTSCTHPDSPVLPADAFVVGLESRQLLTTCSRSAGRLFYVSLERSHQLLANLRVTDVSRRKGSHGVEVPVVREEDFVINRIVLQGVPVDPRFRSTLRIYALDSGPVPKSLDVVMNGVRTRVTLLPGRDAFEPWYAELSDFPTAEELPAGETAVDVVVEDPLGGRGFAGASLFWAFVSVTSNETQEITLVTP